MPWEADGIRWHTMDRITTTGKAVRWQGDILTWVNEQVHRLNNFGETNWNHRTVIEIPGQPKTLGWFLHMMTGQEWVARLVFRVGKNTFKQADLAARLNLPALDDTPGAEHFCDRDRVQVANRKGPWQEVAVLAHKLNEIDTPAFKQFLKEAVAAFGTNVKRLQTKPEDVMPWKVNGERWHLSDKGFPPGRKIRWGRPLLARLLELVRQVEPKLQIEWDARDAILLKVPGVGHSWSRWRTKDEEGLDCRFFGKKGQFNLSRIASFGVGPEIIADRDGIDVVRILFQNEEQLHPTKLKEVLREHLSGFRAVYENHDG